MNTTKLTISNEKQRVDLPQTTNLYPSGMTISGATQGQPLVYHPDLDKLALGEFPRTATDPDALSRVETNPQTVASTVKFLQDGYPISLDEGDIYLERNGYITWGDGSNDDAGLVSVAPGTVQVKRGYNTYGDLEAQDATFYGAPGVYQRYVDLANAMVALGSKPGVTSFTRTGNVLTIGADKNSYSLDLNQTVYGPGSNITADPFFQHDFGQGGGNISGGWFVIYGGWTHPAPGVARSDNGAYLYQDFEVLATGSYRLRVVISQVDQGGVRVFGSEFDLGTIYGVGVHEWPLTLTAGYTHRIHLLGDNFVGTVAEAAVYSTASVLQYPYGYDLFVHKTGDETVAGNKTFTGNVAATTFKLGPSTRDVLSLDQNGNLVFNGGVNSTAIYYGANHFFTGLSIAGSVLIDSGSNVIATGNVQAAAFIGDGSRLTNLPAAAQHTDPVFTASAGGVQTINLATAASALVAVTLLEAGSTTLTRTIWEPYCALSSATLTIAADAQVLAGDKILVKYLH